MSFVKGYIPWNKGKKGVICGLRKGNIPWNYGLNKETDNRVRLYSEKSSIKRKGISPWNKGLTKESNNILKDAGIKISKINKGQVAWNKGIHMWKNKIHPHKGKILTWMVGEKHFRYGKHLSGEFKKKLSDIRKTKIKLGLIKVWNKGRKFPEFSGENSPLWLGGISKLPYSFEFNDRLKSKIRKRDNYKCQICGMNEEEHLIVIGNNLSVHHIDYNKKNSSEYNLIALCKQCHFRTNYNRDYWSDYFKKRMETIICQQ